MEVKTTAITGVNGYVPDYVLTNAELETMVDTNDEWIRTRTGIVERRILKGDKATSDMGYEVVKGLLEKTGTKPEEIDMVICATVTPDMYVSDTANTICDKVGMVNAYGFDLNAACSGFLFALHTGSQFINSGTHKKVIIVGADKMSSIIDYTDRATCIIFGDGAGAVLLEPSEDNDGIQDAILNADGSGREFLKMEAGGSRNPASHETVDASQHFIEQEGRTVFKQAVKSMGDVVQEILEKNNVAPEDLTWLVPHQANNRIISSIANRINFPMDKVMVNIHKYGNTTAATLPLCLWDYEDKLKKGDKLVLTTFGGGFTWGAIYLTWAI